MAYMYCAKQGAAFRGRIRLFVFEGVGCSNTGITPCSRSIYLPGIWKPALWYDIIQRSTLVFVLSDLKETCLFILSRLLGWFQGLSICGYSCIPFGLLRRDGFNRNTQNPQVPSFLSIHHANLVTAYTLYVAYQVHLPLTSLPFLSEQPPSFSPSFLLKSPRRPLPYIPYNQPSKNRFLFHVIVTYDFYITPYTTYLRYLLTKPSFPAPLFATSQIPTSRSLPIFPTSPSQGQNQESSEFLNQEEYTYYIIPALFPGQEYTAIKLRDAREPTHISPTQLSLLPYASPAIDLQ